MSDETQPTGELKREERGDTLSGIRDVILEAIEVLNAGWWGVDGSKEKSDAIRCRSILRKLVPHDYATGDDLPLSAPGSGVLASLAPVDSPPAQAEIPSTLADGRDTERLDWVLKILNKAEKITVRLDGIDRPFLVRSDPKPITRQTIDSARGLSTTEKATRDLLPQN